MIAPGCKLNGQGQITVIAGSDPDVHHFSCGNPFDFRDRIVLCTDSPVGGIPSMWGLRRTPKGAIFGTTVTSPDDVFIGGLRISKIGQIVYGTFLTRIFSNGSPVNAQGVLCVEVGV